MGLPPIHTYFYMVATMELSHHYKQASIPPKSIVHTAGGMTCSGELATLNITFISKQAAGEPSMTKTPNQLYPTVAMVHCTHTGVQQSYTCLCADVQPGGLWLKGISTNVSQSNSVGACF